LCYFPTFLAGPAFQFSMYRTYIDGSLFYHAKYNPTRGTMPPGQRTSGWKTVGTSILVMVLHLVLSAYFDYEKLYVENGLQGNLIWKCIYIHCALAGKRCTYYFAWKLSEGAAIFAGMGFNGWTEKGDPKWDGIANIDILQCELPENVRAITVGWNIKTSLWLRHYVYERAPESLPISSMFLTNIVSAFWHGFYPGYYAAFGYASLCIEEARMLRSILRKYFVTGQGKDEKPLPMKPLYDIGGTFLAFVTFDTGFAVFAGLGLENMLIFLNQIYWWPVIAAALLYPALVIVSSLQPRPIRKKALE